MIGIIDTESQNIGSIVNCLKYLKIENSLIKNQNQLKRCKKIILPGVGSFDAVMDALESKNFLTDDFKKELLKKRVLAICIGMQILFGSSEEGKKKGLNLFDNDLKIKHLKNIGCKGPIPHVGFNSISLKKKNTQIDKILAKDYYFTHSYGLNYNEKNLNFDQFGITNYNKSKFVTFFIYKNIIATQFHPEKSGLAGLKLLNYFNA
jgi:glutamine amidotransferase